MVSSRCLSEVEGSNNESNTGTNSILELI
jgi:hypothetical protein